MGVVEYADHAAEVGESLDLSLLEGAWFFAGGFYFDEADLALGEDDEAVWHAGVCWAGEFWGDSSGFLDLPDQGLFDFSFEHCLCFPVVFWDKVDKISI